MALISAARLQIINLMSTKVTNEELQFSNVNKEPGQKK